MGALLPVEWFWTIIGLISAWTVLMSLEVLAAHLGNAVRRHNLRVEAHRLRTEQQRRLEVLNAENAERASAHRAKSAAAEAAAAGHHGDVEVIDEAAPGPPAEPGDVEVLEEPAAAAMPAAA